MEQHFAHGRAHITALPLLPLLIDGAQLDRQVKAFAAAAQHVANRFAYSQPVAAHTTCNSYCTGLLNPPRLTYGIAAWLPIPATATDYGPYLLGQTGAMDTPAAALAAFAVLLNLADEPEAPAEAPASFVQAA